MQFHLDRFLAATSSLIDFVEMDVLGVTSNHGRRVAYIAARLAERAGLAPEQVFDIVALSILHDNGLAEESLFAGSQIAGMEYVQRLESLNRHCDIGERNIADFPFLSYPANIVRFHHERHDGKGFFGLRSDQTPLMAQLVGLGDYADFLFSFASPAPSNRERVRQFVADQSGAAISPYVAELFLEVSAKPAFWFDLQDDFIDTALAARTPKFVQDISLNRVLAVSRVFSRIVDCKSAFTQRHSSGLEDKAARMAEFYGFDAERMLRLRIAASLHDIGKLAIPNAILNKPGKLTAEEFSRMQEHTYLTRRCLEQVPGFEDITEWGANHHERLDGSGYPFGLGAEALPFEARLMACLDVYQAVTEDRPYRGPLPHAEAMAIVNAQVARGGLDARIAADVDKAFGG